MRGAPFLGFGRIDLPKNRAFWAATRRKGLSVVASTVMVMRGHVRRTADRLLDLQAQGRQVEVSKLLAMLELALEYRVQDCDDVFDVPELNEKLIRIGAAGTPTVSEFLPAELAAMLGISEYSATSRLSRLLNLRYRHEAVWASVLELAIDPALALKVAAELSDLPIDTAKKAGERWLRKQDGLSWGAAMRELEKCIAWAAPEHVAAKEADALNARFVGVHGRKDGSIRVSAQLDLLEGKYLDAAVEQMAGVLLEQDPECWEMNRDNLRAKALGVLANPAYALALLQQEAQEPLCSLEPLIVDGRDNTFDVGGALDDPHTDEATIRKLPHECSGHICGQITVPPSKLQPAVNLFVHIDPDTVETGVARIEQAGAITTKTLTYLLQDKQVVVRPVIDLPNIPEEAAYRPSAVLKEAVILTHEREAFPFSARYARGLDIDHIESFVPTDAGEFTRFPNLMPLSRRIHRAKTAGYWQVRSSADGVEWSSPLGYRYEHSRAGSRQLE